MFAAMKYPPALPLDEPLRAVGEKSATHKKRGGKAFQGDSKASKKRRVQQDHSPPPPKHRSTGRWTQEEHEKFLDGIGIHGKEWKKIASMIDSRTVVQIRTHAQKYFQRIAKKRGMKNSDRASSSGTRASSTKKKSRRSAKTRSRATRSAVARKESSRSSPKKPVPTTAASFKSLTLTLPPEQLKESYREKSPTSVTDLADFPLEAAYMCSPDNFHTVAFLGDDDQLPLSNWLNDVKKSDSDSDSSSDSCSLGSGGQGEDTIYVDTRYGRESTLVSYDFGGHSMYSLPPLLAAALDLNALPL